jgi:hypothetical protein
MSFLSKLNTGFIIPCKINNIGSLFTPGKSIVLFISTGRAKTYLLKDELTDYLSKCWQLD